MLNASVNAWHSWKARDTGGCIQTLGRLMWEYMADAAPNAGDWDASPSLPVREEPTGWRPMSELPPFTVSGPVLMWNAVANAVHAAGTVRIGHPLVENTCDCTHWMPLPASPSVQNSTNGVAIPLAGQRQEGGCES